jgi:uncharacterized protein (TIGR01777 family)
MEGVLITGGSGMVGTALTKQLQQLGYRVSHLGREAGRHGDVVTYKWDYKTGYLDEKAFEGIQYVVNLVGANVGGSRWTNAYKKELYDSRVKTTRLLVDTVKKLNIPLKKVVSTSAVGYYGNTIVLVSEDTQPGNEFLARLCIDWENEAKRFEQLNIPLVISRFGIVFSETGGFIEQVSKPVKLGVGAILGTGQQMISWIHIDDLTGLLAKAITDPNFTGIYNFVSPQPASNEAITRSIAKALNKPLWLPKVPAFALKLLFGEMSYELLASHNASAKKVLDAGYTFKHPDLDEAIAEVLKK